MGFYDYSVGILGAEKLGILELSDGHIAACKIGAYEIGTGKVGIVKLRFVKTRLRQKAFPAGLPSLSCMTS